MMPDQTKQFHYTSQGAQQTPVSFEELRRKALAGLINRSAGCGLADDRSVPDGAGSELFRRTTLSKALLHGVHGGFVIGEYQCVES